MHTRLLHAARDTAARRLLLPLHTPIHHSEIVFVLFFLVYQPQMSGPTTRTSPRTERGGAGRTNRNTQGSSKTRLQNSENLTKAIPRRNKRLTRKLGKRRRKKIEQEKTSVLAFPSRGVATITTIRPRERCRGGGGGLRGAKVEVSYV